MFKRSVSTTSQSANEPRKGWVLEDEAKPSKSVNQWHGVSLSNFNYFPLTREISFFYKPIIQIPMVHFSRASLSHQPDDAASLLESEHVRYVLALLLGILVLLISRNKLHHRGRHLRINGENAHHVTK
jgi:hypothetical protein